MLYWADPCFFPNGDRERLDPRPAYEAIVRLVPAGDFHEKQGRSTGRYLILAAGGPEPVYLKKYFRLPWTIRRFARLARFPGPHELERLSVAAKLGIRVPEPVAVGADREHDCRSFLAIRELTGFVALHLYLRDRKGQLSPAHKQALARRIADIARRMHQAHWFHRDFYLCHLFIRPTGPGADDFELAMIDFGRLLHSHRRRWQVKDLAQLLFSSDEPGITRTDRLRCMKEYLQLPRLDFAARKFARQVIGKARRYREHNTSTKG